MLSHFYHYLLAKAIPEAGPDSRDQEIDSNPRWENVQSHISRGMDAGREIIVDLQTLYLRGHDGLLFQKRA